jgi:threonine/homoserine/homoserine lactone efflux protein
MTSQLVSLSGVWRPLLTLILAAAVVMGSPGPSTMSAAAVGAAYGFRRSLPYAAGLILGTTAALAIVAVGLVALIVSVPHGASALVIVSAVYILYLAVRIAAAPPLGPAPDPATTPAFGGGVLLAVANPKAYLAIAAVFQGTRLFGASHYALDAMVKTAVLAGMIGAIHLSWLAAGASLARLLRDPPKARIVNLALAAILAATALRSLLE